MGSTDAMGTSVVSMGQNVEMPKLQEQAVEHGVAKGSQGRRLPPDFDLEQRYLGIIKSFNKARGFGFIACDETYAAFGCDIFLHNTQREGFEVGDVISFGIE